MSDEDLVEELVNPLVADAAEGWTVGLEERDLVCVACQEMVLMVVSLPSPPLGRVTVEFACPYCGAEQRRSV